MKFSIIVPCYNISKTIDMLFEMMSRVDSSCYEIIFVDDCSPDDSFDIMKAKAKNYNNYIVLQTKENGGPGVARNHGLINASGEYIMFCDSDDEINITAINEVNSFLAEYNDADLLVFPYLVKRRGKVNFCDEYSQYNHGEMIRAVDVAADSGTPWAKVYRKAVIVENNIRFPARKSGEDKCFIVNYCIFIEKVYKISLPYYIYVMNGTSLTHKKNNEQKITTTFEILQPIYREYFPEIEERMYAETHLLTYAKHFSATKAKNKRIKEFYKSANERHPDWINRVNYNKQSLYRKLIYKAMYKNRPKMIKFIMWLRRKIY